MMEEQRNNLPFEMFSQKVLTACNFKKNMGNKRNSMFVRSAAENKTKQNAYGIEHNKSSLNTMGPQVVGLNPLLRTKHGPFTFKGMDLQLHCSDHCTIGTREHPHIPLRADQSSSKPIRSTATSIFQ